jgi:hypothetical protein
MTPKGGTAETVRTYSLSHIFGTTEELTRWRFRHKQLAIKSIPPRKKNSKRKMVTRILSVTETLYIAQKAI